MLANPGKQKPFPLKLRLQIITQRIRHAIAYVTGHLDAQSAQDMIVQLEPIAGWHPLVTLCVDDVLARATKHYKPHPDLRSFVASACAKVARQWRDADETLQAAQWWAIDLSLDLAQEHGQTLALAESDSREEPAAKP